MAILLSEHLNIKAEKLSNEGVFDAVIGVDTKLFIDPSLLMNIKIDEFKQSREKLISYFSKIITLLKFGENERTKKTAIKMLTFPEPIGVSIGYGNDNDNGAGIGPEKAEKIFTSALELYNLGVTDPEIIEIIGIFEEGFGPDLISDMTINILEEDFCNYTQNFCKKLNIKSEYLYKGHKLPKHPEKDEPLIFLPKELLRDLPVAANWEEVFVVAQHNSKLREKVNSLLRGAFDKKVKPTKKDFKKVLWGDKKSLAEVIKIYKEYDADGYDFDIDPLGLGGWYKIGNDIYRAGSYSIIKRPETDEELILASQELVQRFKRSVEDNGANKILYGTRNGGLKPYHEEVSQLIFYSLADSYCKDRNIILIRESDAGSGPVDFAIGSSYDAKILFELKKSSNDIVSGYVNQLDVYQKSENAFHAFYVVLQMTKKSSKIDQILKIEKDRTEKGEKTPDIIIVNAQLKESASKR
jgi:hypothetical protein